MEILNILKKIEYLETCFKNYKSVMFLFSEQMPTTNYLSDELYCFLGY